MPNQQACMKNRSDGSQQMVHVCAAKDGAISSTSGHFTHPSQ